MEVRFLNVSKKIHAMYSVCSSFIEAQYTDAIKLVSTCIMNFIFVVWQQHWPQSCHLRGRLWTSVYCKLLNFLSSFMQKEKCTALIIRQNKLSEINFFLKWLNIRWTLWKSAFLLARVFPERAYIVHVVNRTVFKHLKDKTLFKKCWWPWLCWAWDNING